MGTLFGALLTEAGHEVGLVGARPIYVDAIKRNDGVVVEKDGQRRVVACPVSLDAEDFAPCDLCIVFVKSTATAAVAATAARCVSENGLLLSLQNGLGNGEALAANFDNKRIMAGHTSQAAFLEQPGVIRHTGSGPTALGSWSGDNKAAAHMLADMFNQAGIATQVVDDVHSAIWDKLFVNIGINAIGALANITNGQVTGFEPSRRLARQALDEAMNVARHLGIAMREGIWEHILHIGSVTAQNHCSMWQDFRMCRSTEIDYMHGAVSRLGRENNIPTPVNSVLADLVRAAQLNYL